MGVVWITHSRPHAGAILNSSKVTPGRAQGTTCGARDACWVYKTSDLPPVPLLIFPRKIKPVFSLIDVIYCFSHTSFLYLY